MGSTAGKQKKRRVEKREGAPQVNSPKPDDIRRNGHRRCRHTMTEKWTNRKTERKMRSQNSRTQNNGKGRNNEIRDIERRRRANGGGAHRTMRAETGGRKREKGRGKRGIAGIPARTGHTQETENRKSPTLQKRGSRFCFLFSVYSDYVAFIIASRCLSLQARFI